MVVLAALIGSTDCLANETTYVVRCDGAQTETHFRGCVLGAASHPYPGASPEGRYCGLNVVGDVARCFSVLYEPENRTYYAFLNTVPNEVLATLSLLSQAYHLDPAGFSQPKSYFADVSVLGFGPHEPVQVAVNGNQSGERGRMNLAVNTCMSALSCIRQIDQALATRMEARVLPTGVGGQGGPAGASISWNFFAAELGQPAIVWFCKDGDCAKYQFENNAWSFKEARAEMGEGPAYPNPDGNVSSVSWGHIDGAVISDGMRRAGYAVPSWVYNRRLRCGFVDGVLDSCMWVAIP